MVQMQHTPPRVGESAPDFTLKDSDMNPVSLRDFRGKRVILAFYPAAFSGTCTSELCTLRDQLADLNEANTHVLAISVDLPYSLRHFKQEQRITFPLLSDFDKQVIGAYGIVDSNFNGFSSGVARRSVFVVDPDGNISWAWVSDHQGQHPEYGEILQRVGAVSV